MSVCLSLWSPGCGPVEEGETETVESNEGALNVDYLSSSMHYWTQKKGHNWLVHRAFKWLEDHPVDHNAPPGLDERLVHYGLAFADAPWFGRPDSFDSQHPAGRKVAGVREDLYGSSSYWNSDCDYGHICTEVRFPWSNNKRPNLHLNARYAVHYLVGEEINNYAVDNMNHYPHDTLLRLDGTEGFHSVLARGPGGSGLWRLKGDRYGVELYRLARRFWPGVEAPPRLDQLTRVNQVGRITIESSPKAEVPIGTYMGGNPFVLSHGGGATWPIWVPEKNQYAPWKLLQNQPPRSKRAAAIYLGWALHMLHDLGHPFHAKNLAGEKHRDSEDELDSWIQQGKFNHLPVMQPLWGSPKYAYSSRTVYDPDFWIRLLDEDSNACSMHDDDNIIQRYREAINAARAEYSQIRTDTRPDAQAAIAAYEHLMDIALKNTIMMIACLDRRVGFDGQIRDQHFKPLGAATVIVTRVGGGFLKTIQPGSSGRFLVDVQARGTYRVRVTAPGYSTLERQLVLSDGGFKKLDIRLLPSSSPTSTGINGKVRWSTTGLPGAQVCVKIREPMTSGPQGWTCTSTNSAGQFTIKRWPGKYHVKATKPLWLPLARTVSFTSGFKYVDMPMTPEDVLPDPNPGGPGTDPL
jgi:hypothetical protein